MGHGGRANLSGNDLLFKVLHGNVRPHVTTESNKNAKIKKGSDKDGI